MLIAAVYVVMSILTVVVYAADKRAAVRARRRVPEATLHALELLGGWPGAILAQQLLRHKTRKRGFLAVFWLCVILNVVVVGGYLVLRHVGVAPTS
jgi:uncharacterized membrane protein YsdA (DUF1294 family)